MTCQEFENLITSSLDSELTPPQASAFAAHKLSCRNCRALFDDVAKAVELCVELPQAEPSLGLLSKALVIPVLHPPINCERFDSLVTEFLDGYLEPAIYYAFQEHAKDCEACSETLAGVAFAVTACHSIHFSGVLDVPEALIGRILAETTGVASVGSVASNATGFWARLRGVFGLDGRVMGRPRFASAALIVAVFFFAVASGGSLAPSSIYQSAARFSSKVYSRSAQFAGEVDRFKSSVDDFIDVIDESAPAQPESGERKGSAATPRPIEVDSVG